MSAVLARAVLLELAVLLGSAGLMVRYFRLPGCVPWTITGVVWLSWWLGLSGIVLLTADLSEALSASSSGPSTWLLRSWSVVYWTTFILAWGVLPVLNEAYHRGETEPLERLRQALRANLRSYALMGLCFVCLVLLLVISGRASLFSVSGVCVALGNTYGLLLIVVFMGHGLVEVPRRLWINSCPHRELDLLYFRATEADTGLHDAIYDLQDVQVQLDAFACAPGLEREYAVVRATCDAFDPTALAPGMWEAATGVSTRLQQQQGKETVSLSTLVEIHRQVKAGQERLASKSKQWDAIMARIDIVCLVSSGNLPYPKIGEALSSGPDAGAISKCYAGTARTWSLMSARCKWLWRKYLEHAALRVAAVICFVFSCVVLLGEVTLIFAASGNTGSGVSLLGWLLRSISAASSTPLATQAVSLVPFLYMSVCCFRSLFQLKLFGTLALSGPHQSLPGPLMFNAQQLIRLQFPLGYNFLMTLRLAGGSGGTTAFQSSVMSDMEVVPLLGESFNVYAPLIMVVLCLFTACNGYAKLLHFIGLEHEDLAIGAGATAEGREKIEEGVRLVERSRRQKLLREAAESSYAPPALELGSGGKGSKGATRYEKLLQGAHV